MVLEQLVLVFVVDELCQKLPVARRSFRPLKYDIIYSVAKIRHSLQIDDRFLEMD